MVNSPDTLQRGQLGLFGVIMPGLAQVAPPFNRADWCPGSRAAAAPSVSWPAGAWSGPWSR